MRAQSLDPASAVTLCVLLLTMLSIPTTNGAIERHAAFAVHDVQDGSTMRSRCAVNGTGTSLRVLREVASTIVDVNGQNSSLTLRCTQGYNEKSISDLMRRS